MTQPRIINIVVTHGKCCELRNQDGMNLTCQIHRCHARGKPETTPATKPQSSQAKVHVSICPTEHTIQREKQTLDQEEKRYTHPDHGWDKNRSEKTENMVSKDGYIFNI